MVPPNIFKLDSITDGGSSTERQASYDLKNAGFLVFQVETRLAPPGHLPNQLDTDKGYAPEQTDDLKRQILSALADPLTNGNIYLVGGSAGGTLALWCALDSASTVSGWNEAARSHIKAVVSMSGPADFCDYYGNPGGIPPDALTQFENDLDNYVNLPSQTDCDHDPNQKLDHASPVWLATNGATSSPPPIRLYATNGDPVPNSQATDIFQALKNQYGLGFDVQRWIMSYQYGTQHDHAYKYWHATNDAVGSDGECVSQEVINFLTTP